jgi:Lysozyme like domain
VTAKLAVVAVAAVVVLAGRHGLAAAGYGTARGGTLGCAGLERLWEQAGGSPGAAVTAASVAMAESGGRQYATDYNRNGTADRGYWQVNSTWGALSTYDPLGNARAAVRISHDGTGWAPWVTYDTGAYAGRC